MARRRRRNPGIRLSKKTLVIGSLVVAGIALSKRQQAPATSSTPVSGPITGQLSSNNINGDLTANTEDVFPRLPNNKPI